MALELEIANIEERLGHLDAMIDSCCSNIELNQIGAEISSLECQLAPMKEAAERYEALQRIIEQSKTRVDNRRSRI